MPRARKRPKCIRFVATAVARAHFRPLAGHAAGGGEMRFPYGKVARRPRELARHAPGGWFGFGFERQDRAPGLGGS